ATAAASATPAAGTASVAPASPGEASAAPSPTPTASPVANLLMPQNGTILRAYPATIENPVFVADSVFSVDANAAGPWAFVYELPGIATLSGVGALVPA